MTTSLKPVDLVIIGGGWTGMVMAKEVTARTPLSVLVLERGPARSLADYAYGMDEMDFLLSQDPAISAFEASR